MLYKTSPEQECSTNQNALEEKAFGRRFIPEGRQTYKEATEDKMTPFCLLFSRKGSITT
jgi:hypothetical protein